MLAGVAGLLLGTLAAVPGCTGDAPRIALFTIRFYFAFCSFFEL
jgi:hypothetical protein